MKTRTKQANRRIRLLLLVLAVLFAGTMARAAWLQVVQAAHLSHLAEGQHHESVTTPAGRGTIFDRTGVPLAIGEQTTTVFADPRQVRSPRAVALAAHAILGVSANALYPQLLDKRKQFVYVRRFADPAKAELLAKRSVAGVGFYPEQRRTYPQGPVASQVIGYAGVDNKGLEGLELGYDPSLSGRPGRETIVRDPFGRAIDVLSATPEIEGHDVFTTIDHTIQANAEQVLRQTVSQWHAKDAVAIVLDPKTGDVLAMAQAPGYDANRSNVVPIQLQRNRAVTDTYEPGSTFKLVTVTGVLSEGLVTPSTQFTLPYSIRVADRIIHDAEPRGTETFTVSQILQRSSNVGAITLAEKLGPDRLMEWIKRFGFGQPTGIDFPGESGGLLLPLPLWSGSTIGNVPIGQGIAVTPIQMASVYAAVANGGVWVQPHLVDRVGGRTPHRWTRRRIISPAVDAKVKTMLTGVVANVGSTGTEAAIPGYTVAGKTGTAQKPDGHGGYSDTNFDATFVGMVPASHPRLVVLVMVDEPRLSIFGGVVAAPAFAAIAKFDLQYLEIPPDDPATRTTLGLAGH
jgi:cell division protein FtsI (penicillin-binding protein 3)/stage V sporulation protein D (sporulation-specific penicillin-binding protein)